MEHVNAAGCGGRPRAGSGWAHRLSVYRLLALVFAASCGVSEPAAPQPDFTIAAGDFTTGEVRPGDSTTLTVSSAFRNGFSQSVVFSLTGPPGFSAAFSQCQTVLSQQFFGPPPGATCTATVRVDSAVATGIVALAFEAGTNGYPPKRITVPLAVLPPRPLPASFSVTPNPRTLTMVRGDSAEVVFTLSPRPVGAADVTFTLVGSPFAGIALTWIPSTVVTSTVDTVRLRVKVNALATGGAYDYFIQARLPGMPMTTIILRVNVLATAVAARGVPSRP